jgi:acyl dehydratase
VRTLTELRSKHSKPEEGLYWGINGNTGKIEDMKFIKPAFIGDTLFFHTHAHVISMGLGMALFSTEIRVNNEIIATVGKAVGSFKLSD